MSKEQMIEAIRQQNRSAAVDFLVGFDEKQLQTYLQRLSRLLGRRGRSSTWVRQDQMRAVVTRHHVAA